MGKNPKLLRAGFGDLHRSRQLDRLNDLSTQPELGLEGALSTRNLIDRARHPNIALRDSAGVVRGQRESDLAVADEDVGVMVRRFGCIGNLVDELHRVQKVVELKHALDGASFAVPSMQVL
jgi:hypothetical protein